MDGFISPLAFLAEQVDGTLSTTSRFPPGTPSTSGGLFCTLSDRLNISCQYCVYQNHLVPTDAQVAEPHPTFWFSEVYGMIIRVSNKRWCCWPCTFLCVVLGFWCIEQSKKRQLRMGSFHLKCHRICLILYEVTKVSWLRRTDVYDLGTFRPHFNSFGMFCLMLDNFSLSVLYYLVSGKWKGITL